MVPLGPNVIGFEKDLEEFVNSNDNAGSTGSPQVKLNKRLVALSAGTAAVHLGLLNCGVKAGDEVIVQSFTFCASTHPVTYLGATPVLVDQAQIEARPVWKPMHKQPCYKDVPAYVNGVSEAIFKVGMCLPAGPYVTDEDVKYIVETIKSAIA